MRLFRNLKIYLVLIAIIAIAGALIFNDFLVVGLIILGLVILLYVVWEYFVKMKNKQLEEAKQEKDQANQRVQVLQNEIEELKQRKLNISEIRSILDLGLIEVDTNFRRVVAEKFKISNKSVRFIGTLKVDLIAKYGINLKDLRVKYNEERQEVLVANAIPKFLSFSSRKSSWEISEIMEWKKPMVGEDHWGTTTKLDKVANQIKENIRIDVEDETETGPEELQWLVKPLKDHVEKAIKFIFNNSGYSVVFVDQYDSSFRSIEESGNKVNPKKINSPNKESDENSLAVS